eukprot:m51a1_g8413 hypothetical protein (79) ;mRNA; f:282336-282634
MVFCLDRVELYVRKVELVQEEHCSVVARRQASPMTEMVVDSAVSIVLRFKSKAVAVQQAANEASKSVNVVHQMAGMLD